MIKTFCHLWLFVSEHISTKYYIRWKELELRIKQAIKYMIKEEVIKIEIQHKKQHSSYLWILILKRNNHFTYVNDCFCCFQSILCPIKLSTNGSANIIVVLVYYSVHIHNCCLFVSFFCLLACCIIIKPLLSSDWMLQSCLSSDEPHSLLVCKLLFLRFFVPWHSYFYCDLMMQ